MSKRGVFSVAGRTIRRLVHVLARPVRRDRGRGGVLIQPYRGYGSAEEVYLMGRVFRQPRAGYQLRDDSSSWRDLLDVGRRLLRRGVSGAVLEARCNGTTASPGTVVRVSTDDDGYFRVRLRPDQQLSTDQRWHRVDLQLVEPVELAGDEGAHVHGQVFVPPPTAQRVIISDIDDTVMYTGVVNKAKMMWRLFMQGPHSRVAFPGVASLYRALYRGSSEDECNPMLYVSRAPWSIYEVLQEFFRLHRIPVGPILFLREWGVTILNPVPRRAEDHKVILIREMLDVYRDYPFVLIGDSGQHDPEIYAQIVEEYPGRVEAVYIRNVSRSEDRIRAIEALAEQVIDSGSTLMLAADSFSMAKHAAEHGFIDSLALQEVLKERDEEQAEWTGETKPSAGPPIQRVTEEDGLREVLEEQTAADAPPNVSVESEER